MEWKEILQWLVIIPPWFMLLFLNKYKVKRFMPVTLFSMVILSIIYQVAINFNWFHYKPTLFFLTDVNPMMYGLYPVGTLIMFYLTFGRFWIFILMNTMIDGLHNLFISPYIQKVGLVEEGFFTIYHKMIVMTIIAILLYGYQLWQDEVIQKWKVESH